LVDKQWVDSLYFRYAPVGRNLKNRSSRYDFDLSNCGNVIRHPTSVFEETAMFDKLEEILRRPKPFEFYTAKELWTDPHVSEQMLSFHLNGKNDIGSRKSEFIESSVDWMVSEFGLGPGTSALDFGCGPGLYTTQLARRGVAVSGIDFSQLTCPPRMFPVLELGYG
jgi:hypothetical protein